MIFFLESVIFLFVVIYGMRKRGSLGLCAFVGLFIYSNIFRKSLSEPVLFLGFMILSVVTASSALSASGGVNYLALIIEKLIAKHPSFITLVAPLMTFFMVILCGTSYIVLAILPLVAKISLEENIKPVYPLTGCVIAANHGSLCSPISSPFLAFSHILNLNVSHAFVLMFISSFIGILATIFYNFLRQKTENNPDFQNYNGNDIQILEKCDFKEARKAIIIFILGISFVFILTLMKNFRPWFIKNNEISDIDMLVLMPLIMFSIAGFIAIFCNVKVKDILEQRTMEFGFQSIITILGISWLASTFMENNKTEFTNVLNASIKGHLILLGIILFFSSVFMASQTAAILTIIPLGLVIGFNSTELLRILHLSDGLFFIPLTAIYSYAVECDVSGSTKSGKYVLDHSLMIPGFIATFVSTIFMQLIISV